MDECSGYRKVGILLEEEILLVKDKRERRWEIREGRWEEVMRWYCGSWKRQDNVCANIKIEAGHGSDTM